VPNRGSLLTARWRTSLPLRDNFPLVTLALNVSHYPYRAEILRSSKILAIGSSPPSSASGHPAVPSLGSCLTGLPPILALTWSTLPGRSSEVGRRFLRLPGLPPGTKFPLFLLLHLILLNHELRAFSSRSCRPALHRTACSSSHQSSVHQSCVTPVTTVHHSHVYKS